MSDKKVPQGNVVSTQEENKLNLLLEKLAVENEWLKKEIQQRFASEEHQTIAFMLGQAQLNLMSGDIKFKDFSVKLLNIYAQALRRKKAKTNLKFFEKVTLLYVDEQLSKAKKQYSEYIEYSAPKIVESVNNKMSSQELSVLKLIENLERNTDITELKQLRVSAIMDEFTYKSYKDECEIDQLSIYAWEQQLNAFKPDVVFIESAWRGYNDEWDRKVATLSDEIMGVIRWCKDNNVPTLFWNKEDPIHFQTFLNLAKEVDVVFTTDVDCVERYKIFLNHDKVYWLPFAAQPVVNNPIEKYKRDDAFCFAGAYYVKYPERTADLNNFVEVFSKAKPLVIYDRNYYKNDKNYKFPPKFDFFIKGNLAYDEIDKAYKGYNYSINLNSIKQSQSMFARRVFEVLASNTILVSNYSKGLRLIFGDLVFSSDNANLIVNQLRKGFDNKTYFDYLKLNALRKVMSEHTYSDRLNYIVDKTLGLDLKKQAHVLVVAVVNNVAEYQNVLSSFARQIFNNKKLAIVLNFKHDEMNQSIDIFKNIDELLNHVKGCEANYIGYFSALDYYNKHYLYDLVLTEKYSDAQIIGKSKFYQAIENEKVILTDGETYTLGTNLQLRNSLIKTPYLLEHLDLFKGNLDKKECAGPTISTDYFGYCKDFYKYSFAKLPVELNEFNINTGLAFKDFGRIVHKEISTDQSFTGKEISALTISEWFTNPANKPFDIVYEAGNLLITSNLENTKHDYIYTKRLLTLDELGWSSESTQNIFIDTTPGLNIQMVVKYIDGDKKPISHQMIYPIKNDRLTIPKGCVYVSIGFRLYGKGQCGLKAIKLYHKLIDPSFVLSNRDYLVVTNHYPSYTDLYKNGFVHSRVKSYFNSGVECDVFRVRPNETVSYHEFEGIDVTTGSLNALNSMIKNNHYKTIMVHFLDENMWSILEKYSETHKIIVWVHGAEIQAWFRRAFNYDTDEQRHKAEVMYQQRAIFWTKLFSNLPENVHFVFVSNQFATEVMNDLQVQIPANQFSIINNPINRDVFTYQAKTAEMRKKILSIRPYASKTYANDLTVKAILELAKESFFNELEFRLIGSGPLFDETLEPVKHFKNVIIERKFLTHNEIATLHKEYGVFLCPSRMDTQGVSRDEAMSSGLVPITNKVGAIPEFMDDFPELMVEAENHVGLADVICKLYRSPRSYVSLSKKVSKSILNRESRKILSKEVKLIQS